MREDGYYWIRSTDNLKDSSTENGWEVAYFTDGGWLTIWEGGSYTDDELFEINENKLENKFEILKGYVIEISFHDGIWLKHPNNKIYKTKEIAEEAISYIAWGKKLRILKVYIK